jgi:AcrR family transcriptional regulator
VFYHGTVFEVKMAIPEPPWWAPRKAPRAALSREAIVDAAIELLDREGIAGFSMRRLADALGTGPASLYWHVSGKAQLFEMIVDRLVEQQGQLELGGHTWQEQVAAWARQVRRVGLAHPWLSAPEADVFPTGPNVLRGTEMLLGAMRSGGIPDRVAAVAVHLLPLFVTAFVRDEITGLRGHGAPVTEVLEQIGSYFELLPDAQFPNLRAVSADIIGTGWDDRFELLIAVFISGLAAQANR